MIGDVAWSCLLRQLTAVAIVLIYKLLFWCIQTYKCVINFQLLQQSYFNVIINARCHYYKHNLKNILLIWKQNNAFHLKSMTFFNLFSCQYGVLAYSQCNFYIRRMRNKKIMIITKSECNFHLYWFILLLLSPNNLLSLTFWKWKVKPFC